MAGAKGALARKREHSEKPLCKVLLVLALPEEREYLFDVLEKRRDKGWSPGGRAPVSICSYASPAGRIQVIVSTLDGMGPIEAALGVATAVTAHTPDLVVMIGLAGALDHDKVGLGDVVVSSNAKVYTIDKVGAPGAVGRTYRFETPEDRGTPRPDTEVRLDPRDRFMTGSYLRYLRDVVRCPTGDELIASVQTALDKCPLEQLDPKMVPDACKSLKPFKRDRIVRPGWILGSSHVVDSGEYRRYLIEKDRDLTKDVYQQTGSTRNNWDSGELVAVDMESYAMLRVVTQKMSRRAVHGGSNNLLGGLVVRGISDMCEEKADLDALTNDAVRRLAVENATLVGLTLIESLDYPALIVT